MVAMLAASARSVYAVARSQGLQLQLYNHSRKPKEQHTTRRAHRVASAASKVLWLGVGGGGRAVREHMQVWRERKDLALIVGHFELKRLGAARHEVVNGEGRKGHEHFGLRFVGGRREIARGGHGHEALFEILGNNVASCVHRRLERAERGLSMCVYVCA